MGTTKQLRISLFGSFRLVRDGIEVSAHDWHTRQARQVLKVLLAERGRLVSSRKLLALLWPEQVEHAHKALRSAISSLRDVLEPDREAWLPSSFVPRGQGGYMFVCPPQCEVWVDVFEFERLLDAGLTGANLPEMSCCLEQALQLYEGEYLAADGEVSWLLSERSRLHERYFAGVLRLMEWRGKNGLYSEAIVLGQRALELDACREPVYRLIMRYQALVGDTVAALQTFERCRQTIDDELGADPSAQTLELHQAILTGTFPLPDAALPAVLDAPEKAESPFTRREPPFVGRRSELYWLIRHLLGGSEQASRSRAVALVGEAGIGKSSLLRLFLKRAQEKNIQTLAVTCQVLEQDMSFASLLSLLKTWSLQASSEQLACLPEMTLTWIASVLPELAPRLPKPARPSFEQPELAYSLLVNGLVDLFVALCQQQPLVLAFDDLQWADTSTLRVLNRLIHLDPPASAVGRIYPLLLFLSYRPEEIGENASLSAMLRACRRENCLPTLQLNGFTSDEIAEFLRAYQALHLPAEALSQVTRGNALFLSEAVHALVEQQEWQQRPGDSAGESRVMQTLAQSSSIRELVLGRVERLPQEAVDLLEMAAVIGRPFPPDLLRSDFSPGDARFLDLLLKHRFLLEDATIGEGNAQLALSHDLVGQIIVANCSLVRLAYLHLRIAQQMERAYALQIESHAAEIAHHYRLAGQGYTLELVYYTLLAAEYARRTFSYHQALAHYDTALHLLQHLQGEERSEEWLENIYRGRCLVYEALLDWRGLQEQLRQVSLWAATKSDLLLVNNSMQRMIATRSLMGYCAEAVDMGLQFLPLLHMANEQVSPSAQTVRENLRLQVDLLSHWAQILSPQDIEEFLPVSPASASNPFPSFRFAVSPDVPDWERASATLGAAQSACLLTQYGWTLLLQGFLSDAERCLQAAVKAAEATGQVTWEIIASLHLCRIWYFSGQYQRGEQEFAHCLDLCRQVSEAPWVVAWPLLNQSYYLLALGQLNEAERMFLQLREQLAGQDLPAYHYSTQIGLGLVALDRRQYKRAQHLLCEALEQRQNIYVEAYVLAEIGLARIAQHQGASTEAYERLRRLLDFSGKRGLLPLYAASALALARLRLPTPQEQEVIPLLEDVQQSISAAGYTGLARECRALLAQRLES